MRDFRVLLEALLGTPEARALVRASSRKAREVPERLKDFTRRFPQASPSPADAPIFLLSAGWRSGSTLLQRMVMAKQPDLVIWGEPFDRANIVDRMMDQFRCFTEDWPWPEFFHSSTRRKDVSDQWVANFYPEAEDLLRAHRSFFDTLFKHPGSGLGCSQWGIKEVRLTIDHAHYLRFLYPQAKFLLLYRNPFDAYRSYRKWRRWFRTWPDQPILSPYAFGRNWAELAGDFLGRHGEVAGLLLRYEDLDDPATVKKVEAYLGWPIVRSAQMARVGGSSEGRRRIWAPRIELALVRLGAGTMIGTAGYGAVGIRE